MQDLIAKAATLLEALPYIQRFSGETFVVKYGGSFMDSPDPAVRAGVARDIVFLEAVEINPVVVHGGGKAITRAMEKAGLLATFIQGQLGIGHIVGGLEDSPLAAQPIDHGQNVRPAQDVKFTYVHEACPSVAPISSGRSGVSCGISVSLPRSK